MVARRSTVLVTGPAVEPVTVDELKIFARLDGDDEDTLLAEFLQAARIAAEQWTHRSFITQTHKLTLDLTCDGILNGLPEGTYNFPITALYGDLPGAIDLPKRPLQSVTSISTYDLSNASAPYDASNYLVSIPNSRITLNQNAIWPSNLRPNSTCEVIFVSGYGDTADKVPAPIRMAIKIHAAALYETRGQCDCGTPPPAAQALLRQFRIMSI